MTFKEKNARANNLFLQERFEESLQLVDELVGQNYPPAFVLKGFINEFRTDAQTNYNDALNSYLQASVLLRDPRVDIHLARINMKIGHRDNAFRFLTCALKNKLTPDAFFLAGDFYSMAIATNNALGPSVEELRVASNYYLKAAMKGRINALIRYKWVQIELGRPLRALIAGCALATLGPIARMLLGARAYYRY